MATANEISIRKEARKHIHSYQGMHWFHTRAAWKQGDQTEWKYNHSTYNQMQLCSDTSSNLVNCYSQVPRVPKALQIGTEEAEIQAKAFCSDVGRLHIYPGKHLPSVTAQSNQKQQRGLRKFDSERSVCAASYPHNPFTSIVTDMQCWTYRQCRGKFE